MNDKCSKKKLSQKNQKAQERKHIFKHITKHIRRGSKKSLVRVHKGNEDLKIQRTHVRKE